MHTCTSLLSSLLLVLSCVHASAQIQGEVQDSVQQVAEDNRFPSSQGSLLFGGSLNYSSTVPDKGDALSTFAVGLNVHTFLVRGVSVGAEVGSTSISDGTTSVTSLAIGPRIQIMLGSSKSRVYPYLHAAYNHLSADVRSGQSSSTNVTGSSFKVGVGFLFKSFTHVGVPLEMAANFQSFDKVKITVYSVSFGVSGFLYGLF